MSSSVHLDSPALQKDSLPFAFQVPKVWRITNSFSSFCLWICIVFGKTYSSFISILEVSTFWQIFWYHSIIVNLFCSCNLIVLCINSLAHFNNIIYHLYQVFQQDMIKLKFKFWWRLYFLKEVKESLEESRPRSLTPFLIDWLIL